MCFCFDFKLNFALFGAWWNLLLSYREILHFRVYSARLRKQWARSRSLQLLHLLLCCDGRRKCKWNWLWASTAKIACTAYTSSLSLSRAHTRYKIWLWLKSVAYFQAGAYKMHVIKRNGNARRANRVGQGAWVGEGPLHYAALAGYAPSPSRCPPLDTYCQASTIIEIWFD